MKIPVNGVSKPLDLFPDTTLCWLVTAFEDRSKVCLCVRCLKENRAFLYVNLTSILPALNGAYLV